MEALESAVEALCQTILKTDAEDWEVRNRAMLQLTELIAKHKDDPPTTLNEIFTANVFRSLKEPIKSMILDLRSQQVRDTCQFLIKLAEVSGDRMRALLRDSFSTILDGVKIPHKVTSGYIDECITQMIKHVTFKGAIVHFMHELKDSKSKTMRERCLDYINLILMHWDVTDKELDFFADAIKIGLDDASVRAREIARVAYLNMYNLYPEKAEKIKGMVSKQMQQKLIRCEEEGLGSVGTSSLNSSVNLGFSIGSVGLKSLAQHLNGTGDSMELSLALDEAIATPMSSAHSNGTRGASTKSTVSGTASHGSAKHTVTVAHVAHHHATHLPVASHHTASTTSKVSQAHQSAAHHAPSKGAAVEGSAPAHKPVATSTVPRQTLRKPTVGSGYGRAQPSSSEALSTTKPAKLSGGSAGVADHSVRGSVESLKSTRGTTETGVSQHQPDAAPSAEESSDPAVEQAVLSIQARMRGALTRRRSVVHNPFAALAASSPPPQPLSGQAQSSGGSLSSAASSGHTSTATRSTVSHGAIATPSHGPGFSTSTKDRPATAATPAASTALRTPATKRTGLRGSQDTSHIVPAPFCTSTAPSVHASTVAPASSRKASTGSAEPSTATRSVSAARSPRPASTSVVPSSSTARSRSAGKTRGPGTATSANSSAISSPERPATSNMRANRGGESLLALDDRVNVVTAKDRRLPGTVRFIGSTAFAAGTWIGVALDTPQGKNDGSVVGRRYFECAPDHGLFVKEEAVERIPATSTAGGEGAMGSERDGSVSEASLSQETAASVVDKRGAGGGNGNGSGSGGAITGVLKLKLAQMMEMLNHQLEIVVKLEEEDRARDPAALGYSKRASELYAEVLAITNMEQNLIGGFKQHLTERLLPRDHNSQS